MLFRKLSLDAIDPEIRGTNLVIYPPYKITIHPDTVAVVRTDIEIQVPDNVVVYFDYHFGQENNLPGIYTVNTTSLQTGTFRVELYLTSSLPYEISIGPDSPIVTCVPLYRANVAPQEVQKFPTESPLYGAFKEMFKDILGGTPS
jgi:hypothetical protein